MIQYSWCMIVSSGVLSRYRIYVRTVPVGAGAVFTFESFKSEQLTKDPVLENLSKNLHIYLQLLCHGMYKLLC